jgi:hypothetical protein
LGSPATEIDATPAQLAGRSRRPGRPAACCIAAASPFAEHLAAWVEGLITPSVPQHSMSPGASASGEPSHDGCCQPDRGSGRSASPARPRSACMQAVAPGIAVGQRARREVSGEEQRTNVVKPTLAERAVHPWTTSAGGRSSAPARAARSHAGRWRSPTCRTRPRQRWQAIGAAACGRSRNSLRPRSAGRLNAATCIQGCPAPRGAAAPAEPLRELQLASATRSAPASADDAHGRGVVHFQPCQFDRFVAYPPGAERGVLGLCQRAVQRVHVNHWPAR